MSTRQLDTINQMLRSSGVDLGGDVHEQRPRFAAMMTAIPLPEDVRAATGHLNGVPVVTVTVDGVTPTGTILYLHGGAHALGSADQSARLASELARRAGSQAVSVDFALAPEHPYPAAVHDVVEAYRGLLEDGMEASNIVVVGESSGGGLALTATQEILSAGLPRPAGIYLASPWVDLTTSGASMTTKAQVDPSVTPDGLRRRARDYAGDHDLRDGRLNPLFGDLTGFPPLLIHVGGNEVLLDDATRVATRAAADGVRVTMEVSPGAPHVFVGFIGMLEEADRAVTTASRFITEHLNSATPSSTVGTAEWRAEATPAA